MFVIIGIATFTLGLIISVFIIALRHKANNARRRKSRRTTAETSAESSKRKLEFAQFIIALYAFACIGWITADYALAFMYQQPINTQVTVTLATTIVVAILGYYTKSAFEKSNRNKYSLDEDGVPFGNDGEGS